MAALELPVESKTDVGALWKAAISRYEKITMVKIQSLAGADNVDEILMHIHDKEKKFTAHRHDGSKTQRFRTLVSKVLGPIEKLSSIVGSAVSASFPPSAAIFTAIIYLIKATNSVSADYDKIVGFFEDLELYLNRLKILEKWVPPVPELELALTEVLTSVLILCGICAKYIKMKRVVKAFRNLVSGDDDKLSDAYKRFHKMVEQEQGAVRNATLVAVGQLQKETTAIQVGMRESLAITERIDLNAETLMASTERLQTYLERRESTLERDDILKRLSSLDFHEKQKDIFAKHHYGTGQWLLKTSEFQRWFKGTQHSVLWCPGIPGAGKSVITSLAVDHVHEAIQGTKAAIVYIYCDYKNPKTQSELELLASIARQLIEQTSSIPLAVKEFCDKNALRRRNTTGDEWISLVKSICPLFQAIYVFVDALDECPEINRENFLRLIEELEPLIRLFITSRPHVGLQAKFPNKSRIDISARKSDIEIYLKSKISTNNRLSSFTTKDMKLEQEIVENLSTKAAGMFLLAHLQMDHLCRQSSLKYVRKAMSALPTEVFGTYEEAMKRIKDLQEEDSQLARRAISYIFCARRRLNVEELRHMLAVEVEDTQLDETAFPETEILLNISAGLIRIDEESGTVGLVHYTLQEYLEKNREKLLPDPDVEIAQACLAYLSFDIFEEGPCSSGEGLHHRLEEYQFLDYASHNWGHHIKEHQLDERVVSLLLSFLKDRPKLSSLVQILYIASRRINDWHDRFPKQFGPLHVAAYWGLDKILISLFEDDIDVDSRDSYGVTGLQLAAKHGHKSAVQLLLNRGANVNITNENGETALYWAARNGHQVIVELLLADRANVLVKDNEGWTALDWAVVGGMNDVVKMLLDHGHDIAAEEDGQHKALYLAAEEGHELTVKMLLDNGVDVNAQDSLGSTALDFALPSAHEKTVQVLLHNGADLQSRDTYGNTALHWAVPYKSLTRLLLDHGADVDAKNYNKQTALCWAAQDGSVAVVEELLNNNADINAKDSHGFTPLHRATLRGREVIVDLLLEKGANPNIKDKDQWTPLHVAALKQHTSLVDVLLDRVDNGRAILDWVALQLQDTRKKGLLEEAAERKAEASTVITGLRSTIQSGHLGRSRVLLGRGADVNGKDIGGDTALIIAVSAGDKDAVQLLLENGADISINGSAGWTPLHWACDCGHQEVAMLLVQNGADVNASIRGWTPMLLAAKSGYMLVVQFLIDKGADVNAEDCQGRTGLHWAAKSGDQTTVRMLVTKGAKLDSVDRWGKTALIWAVENMQQRILKMLVQLGADLEARTRHKLTALHIAAFMDFKFAAISLLDRGAYIEAKTRHNLTALHIAAFMGSNSVVKCLLRRGADKEAEAQWRGAGDGEESDRSESEEDEEEDTNTTAESLESLSDLLLRWPFEHGQYGVTARELAAEGGYFEVQQLLG